MERHASFAPSVRAKAPPGFVLPMTTPPPNFQNAMPAASALPQPPALQMQPQMQQQHPVNEVHGQPRPQETEMEGTFYTDISYSTGD